MDDWIRIYREGRIFSAHNRSNILTLFPGTVKNNFATLNIETPSGDKIKIHEGIKESSINVLKIFLQKIHYKLRIIYDLQF